MATTVCAVPDGYPTEIIGYADPWIVSPGDTVDIKVSSTAATFSHRTVRLIQGLDGPHAPEVRVEEIAEISGGTCSGRFQQAHPGSYAVVDSLGLRADDEGLAISLYVQPFLVQAGHDQTIVSVVDEASRGVAVILGVDGRLKVRVGDGRRVDETDVDYEVVTQQWLRLDVRVRGARLALSVEPVVHLGQRRGQYYETAVDLPGAVALPVPGRLAIAATRPSDAVRATDCFNGRIEAVTLTTAGTTPRPVAKLDFSLQIPTDEIVDTSGHRRHGVLVNAPTRAVRGHDWDGSETNWTKATYGYGAIHFHEDDLDDAGWATDLTIRIPDGARSGAYAVEVRNGDDAAAADSIVFFVRPARTSTATVAMVLSTFTYTAYANERMYDEDRSSYISLRGLAAPRADEDFARMRRRTDLGLSLYDVHRDGSGSVFSSSRRPVLNVRPGFQHWAFARPREFGADLLMVGFLEARLGAGGYDVLTDHDLHARGVGAVERYSTLVTGSHPEYPSLRSLDAYAAFAARGGNLMYLGGNGFYWISVPGPDVVPRGDDGRYPHPHRLEVRRGDTGVRTFEMAGGERHHGLNGTEGGRWRGRGRASNYLVGVGTCGEGVGPGVPYRRKTTADASVDWVFAGIAADELIGVDGFGGGASGDEIDRWDPRLGSPETATVLASSTGHPDEFGLFPEDCGFQDTAILGSQTDRVRSDIVLFRTPGGGSVFSVGSMNWFCSLAWDGYDNNVARMTENVLRRFAGV